MGCNEQQSGNRCTIGYRESIFKEMDLNKMDNIAGTHGRGHQEKGMWKGSA